MILPPGLRVVFLPEVPEETARKIGVGPVPD
jgi:hypothetical protein